MTINKAEIFANLLRRNQLRLSAGLSSLNIRDELASEVAAAAESGPIDPVLAAEHAADRLLIEATVIAELQMRDGVDAVRTAEGRDHIRREVAARFAYFLARQDPTVDPLQGIPVPVAPSATVIPFPTRR